MTQYIAHIRESDGRIQTVEEHLTGVAELARAYGAKFGFGEFCELIGLLHDVGKYSLDFQKYIASSEGLTEQDADDDAR